MKETYLLSHTSSCCKRKKAFTLAEVLTTLGIIGVVAAITIPSALVNSRERENISKLKKVYTNLGQSFSNAVYTWGTPDNWDLVGVGSGEGAENLSKIITPYFRIQKNCRNNGGCWYNKETFLLNRSYSGKNFGSDTKYATIQIVDGMYFAYYIEDPNCQKNVGDNKGLDSVCATITVDLNSERGPNEIGYDIHNFYVTKYNIQPYGQEMETEYTFADNCVEGKNSDGYGCSAWVIFKSNMDYLHCNTLSWGGKSTCKKKGKDSHSDL